MNAGLFPDFRHIPSSVGNNGIRYRGVVTNVRKSFVCIRGKFGLEVGGPGQRQRSSRNGGAHIKHTERPAEVQTPSGDRILVTLRVEESRDRVPLPSFDSLAAVL